MIEAVLFDIGGTLHRSTARADVAPALLRSVISVDLPDEDVRGAYRETHATIRARYAASGERCTGARLAEVAREHTAAWLARLGQPATSSTLDAIDAAWRRLDPAERYLPGAREAVRTLAATGLQLGIVSNTFRDHRETLVRDVGDVFGAVVLSIEVGVWKPDPEIYRIACRALGLDVAQVVHVGDKLDKDVLPARAAGLHAIQLDDRGYAPVLAEIECLRRG
jgi:putative hydrolase of the HAD superfamily